MSEWRRVGGRVVRETSIGMPGIFLYWNRIYHNRHTLRDKKEVHATVRGSSIVPHDILRAFCPVPLVLFLLFDITLVFSASVASFYVSGM